MLESPFCEETFPDIQSKPPLLQLETVSSFPIACCLEEETHPHLATASIQVVLERDDVIPGPLSFLSPG